MDPSLIWLTLSRTPGAGPKTINSIWDRCLAAGIGIADLAELSAEEMIEEMAIPSRVAVAFRQMLDENEDSLRIHESLGLIGAEVVSLDRPEYPAALRFSPGSSSPPVLFCTGDLSLFEEPMLAVVGSRDADEEGLRVAGDFSRAAVEIGYAVVSGGARGVDMAAHRAALEAGGGTIVVLSHGLLELRTSLGLAELGRFLLVSEFAPNQTWTAGLAMARNRTVASLAKMVFVAQARQDSGTMNTAEVARKLGKPLAAADFPGRDESSGGNRTLIRAGAFPIPSELPITPAHVREASSHSHQGVKEAPGQLDLF